MDLGYNPFSHKRLALDAAKSLEHVMGDAKPLRDLRLTRRAQRVQNRYDRGATARLRAQFLADGEARVRHGRLRLTQRDAQPSWTEGRFGKPVTVTIHPGEPTAAKVERRYGEGDGIAWRVRLGAQEGTLVLPLEFAAAFAPHLSQRPAAGG